MRSVWALAAALFLGAACNGRDTESDVCKASLTKLAPTATNRYVIDAGRVVRFHAESRSCTADPLGVRWTLDDRIVAYSNDYDYIACNEDEGVHVLSAQAITYATTDTASVEQVIASHSWALSVKGVAKPKPPSCYAGSIRDIQMISSADLADEQRKLTAAVDCLDGYLSTYACDFKASYATGLAKSALLGESFFPLYQRRASLTVEDVRDIVTKQIEPIRQNFLVVYEKAPKDFSFNVDGRFRIYAFHDDPKLSGDDTIYFDAYGRHDKSEALFILTVMNYFDGGLNVILSNTGTLEFGLKTPDNETPQSLSDRVIKLLETQPTFLTWDDGRDAEGKPLNDAQGLEGKRLIAMSQNSFIQGLNSTIQTFLQIQSENHNQTLDLARYWDCGKDAVCPATCSYMDGEYFNDDHRPDPAEHHDANCDAAQASGGGGYDDNNLNGKCDEGWTKADFGECNLKYDEGEALGTERIGFGADLHGNRIGPSFDIPKVLEVLHMVRDNIRGPDYLDLDHIGEIVGAPPKFVSATLQGLEVPFPMLRISEFFHEPTQFRDLVPLYDKKANQFIVGLESEPYSDTGYDGLLNAQETGYDLVANRDPNHDDMDPYCNPDCNQDDLRDNDGDGKIDNADRDHGVTRDLGVEGNFVFDFIDMKGGDGKFNKLHDPGEVSEPFKDVGTLDNTDRLIGKGDGKWNKADRAHPNPSGADVGPVTSLGRPDDPFNGTLIEQPRGLLDPYYYFLQDPNMTGAIRFAKDPYDLTKKYENAAGQELTDSALNQRFISKLLELAAEPPIPDFAPLRDDNGHACDTTVAQCNHWANPTMGYQ
jgi:hypothetical protein